MLIRRGGWPPGRPTEWPVDRAVRLRVPSPLHKSHASGLWYCYNFWATQDSQHRKWNRVEIQPCTQYTDIITLEERLLLIHMKWAVLLAEPWIFLSLFGNGVLGASVTLILVYMYAQLHSQSKSYAPLFFLNNFKYLTIVCLIILLCWM